jgi:hypothetical protein
MDIICKVSEEVEVALSLLADSERELVLQRFTTIGPSDIKIDIQELWEAELKTPECDIERVKRLGSAYRLLGVHEDDLEDARAFLKRATG